ncbi:hypothetical protein HY256_08200 [Candidatus Sumerlaeota bacterium]|nr:hypothetical protein [Candidatus Sumerlaeota bacterium]
MRSGEIKVSRAIKSLTASLVALVFVSFVAFGANWIGYKLCKLMGMKNMLAYLTCPYAFVILILISTACFILLQTLTAHRWGLANVCAGNWLLWWLLAGLTAFGMPGASYLFAVPFVFILLGALVFFTGGDNADSNLRPLLYAMFGLPSALLLTPTICLVWISMTSQAIGPISLLGNLLLALLLPVIRPRAGRPAQES